MRQAESGEEGRNWLEKKCCVPRSWLAPMMMQTKQVSIESRMPNLCFVEPLGGFLRSSRLMRAQAKRSRQVEKAISMGDMPLALAMVEVSGVSQSGRCSCGSWDLRTIRHEWRRRRPERPAVAMSLRRVKQETRPKKNRSDKESRAMAVLGAIKPKPLPLIKSGLPRDWATKQVKAVSPQIPTPRAEMSFSSRPLEGMIGAGVFALFMAIYYWRVG